MTISLGSLSQQYCALSVCTLQMMLLQVRGLARVVLRGLQRGGHRLQRSLHWRNCPPGGLL